MHVLWYSLWFLIFLLPSPNLSNTSFDSLSSWSCCYVADVSVFSTHLFMVQFWVVIIAEIWIGCGVLSEVADSDCCHLRLLWWNGRSCSDSWVRNVGFSCFWVTMTEIWSNLLQHSQNQCLPVLGAPVRTISTQAPVRTISTQVSFHPFSLDKSWNVFFLAAPPPPKLIF